MNDIKIAELSKRTINILEKTKKQYKEFENERKQLYYYLVNENDLKKWEKYIEKIEALIK